MVLRRGLCTDGGVLACDRVCAPIRARRTVSYQRACSTFTDRVCRRRGHFDDQTGRHRSVPAFAYFKRHLVREEAKPRGETKVLPLPFSIANLRPLSGRSALSTDAILLGGSNVPGGKGAYENAIRQVTSNVIFGQRSYEDMMDAVSSSKIAVAPRGLGQDTLRMWEFLGIEGPLVAIQRHSLVEVGPLLDGAHVAWFSNPEELSKIVSVYLADVGTRAQVAAQGFAFAKEKHTVKARAQYLMEKSLA